MQDAAHPGRPSADPPVASLPVVPPSADPARHATPHRPPTPRPASSPLPPTPAPDGAAPTRRAPARGSSPWRGLWRRGRWWQKAAASIILVVVAVESVALGTVLWRPIWSDATTEFQDMDARAATDPGFAQELGVDRADSWTRLALAHPTRELMSINDMSIDAIAGVVIREDGDIWTRPPWMPLNVQEQWERSMDWVDQGKDLKPSGSSIPQQLAKYSWTSGSRSGARKAWEAVLAFNMSALSSPIDVVERYLNTMETGPGVYGLCAASWLYFNKPPSHMTAQDAATIVGLLPAPKNYWIYDRHAARRPSLIGSDTGVTSGTIRFARGVTGRAEWLKKQPYPRWRELLSRHNARPQTCTQPPASLLARRAVLQPGGVALSRHDQDYWPRMARQIGCGEAGAVAATDRDKLIALSRRTPGTCAAR